MKDLLLSILHTKNKTSIVGAINELVAKIGTQDLSSLDTATKDNLINAINELSAKIDSAATGVGDLSSASASHYADKSLHVTSAEKSKWNAKANEADVISKISAHEDEELPHTFIKDGKSYKYGLSINSTGDGVVFNYEEVTK